MKNDIFETVDELLAAYCAGKTIQIRDYSGNWGTIGPEHIDKSTVSFLHTLVKAGDYRVKPEPKTRRMTIEELEHLRVQKAIFFRRPSLGSGWKLVIDRDELQELLDDESLVYSIDLKTWSRPEVEDAI